MPLLISNMNMRGFSMITLLNKKRKNNKHTRFLAMSKLIGWIVVGILIIVMIYALIEMHIQRNLDALPQLLISVFGIVSVYIGFYLTMAKWEHVEAEKTARQKELIKLKKSLGEDPNNIIQEQINNSEAEINELDNKASELEHEDINQGGL